MQLLPKWMQSNGVCAAWACAGDRTALMRCSPTRNAYEDLLRQRERLRRIAEHWLRRNERSNELDSVLQTPERKEKKGA